MQSLLPKGEPRTWVVIPAAGAGSRMGASARPKQYLELAGQTLIEWAVAPFIRHERCERIVVVLAKQDPYWPTLSLSRHERIMTAEGGSERAASVRAGLAACAAEAAPEDWILVHDAARPCLSDEELDRLVVQLRADQVGGLLAAPLVDTLKRADEQGCVIQTVPRAALWRALTPQMFRYGVLRRALALAAERGIAVTDESQAVELLGLRPRLVAGSANNLKVTAASDLEQAARILAARE